MIPALQPMDVIVVDGEPGNLLHASIKWRGLDPGVHCCTVKSEKGDLWSPEGKGILDRSIDHYVGRSISIHRYRLPFNKVRLLEWCYRTQETSKGYDFMALLGFATGLNSLANDEERWYCSEFPYWAFQGNGYTLTPNEEQFIYPRLFRFNPLFNEIWRGTLL